MPMTQEEFNALTSSEQLETVQTTLYQTLVDGENASKLWQNASGTVTLRNGDVVDNLRKRLEDIGFNVPVDYETNLSITSTKQTVVYENKVYAPVPTELPLDPTGAWDSSKWYLLIDFSTFDNVTDLLASTLTFSEGEILRTRVEGFSYQVAATGASDHQTTTAGGVKLYDLQKRNVKAAEYAAATPDGTVVYLDGLPYESDSASTGSASATNDLGVDGLKVSGPHASPYHYGAVGDGTTDDTAAFQAAHDNNTSVVAEGTFEIRGLSLRGADKHLDFTATTISNDSTDGTDTFLMGDGGNFSASTFKLGKVLNGENAGHGIKVVGTCRGSGPTWHEFRVKNVQKSAIRGYGDEGAAIYDWQVNGQYTRSDLDNLHEVPLIDIKSPVLLSPLVVIQGNTWRFGFAYGSSYTGGDYAIPFMSLIVDEAALLLKNDIFIDVGEHLNGGAVHMSRVMGSRVEVTAYDTSTWVGDMVRSTDGRSNSYKVFRRGGTRTDHDWGAGAVSPYDINVDDLGSFIDGNGMNSTSVRLFVNTANDIGITHDKFVEASGSGDLKALNKMSRVQAMAGVVGSTGALRSGAVGITSVTQGATGEYVIVLDEELPQAYWPVMATCNTAGISDVDLTAQVVYNTSDRTEITVVTADSGTKANKNFSILVMRP